MKNGPCIPDGGNLNTIIKGMGIMYLPKTDAFSNERAGTEGPPQPLPSRWLAVPDLFTSMGFPVTPEAVQACCGARCTYSRGFEQTPGRSHNSSWHQVGNTMHLNMIGAAKLVVLILLPSVGRMPAQDNASQSSRFSAAFHRALKRART